MGKKIGDKLDVFLPNGKVIQVKILDVTNS
jgi:transcription elongation GreA/GreB family factor